MRGASMKKLLMTLLAGSLSLSVLIACENDDAETTTEDPETEEVAESEGASESEAIAESTTDESNDSEGEDIEVPESQTGLRIGETAIVQSPLGTYELTLNSAELVGTELDGQEAYIDELIVLNLTYKNIGDESFKGEHEMINFGIATEQGGYQNTNAASSFESIEFFEGDIEPGETREAQFIADTKIADEYYFETGSGVVASGTYDEISWTITAEEAQANN